MKIALDISVLGVGHYIPRARTGIFRVIEHTAMGLAESKECELGFCASQGNYSQCADYLKSIPQFADYELTQSGNYVNLLRGIISNLIIRIDNANIKNKLANLRDQLIIKSIFPKGIEHKSRNVDIYHSPLYPLPNGMDYTKLRVFQTVYDLIPILLPQYFEFGEDQLIKNMLNSLSPDTFIISISESTKNDLCNCLKWLKPEKVFVVPLAASENFYECSDKQQLSQVRNKYNIPGDSPYFLSVSTLEPRKNIELTIKCFVKLAQEQKLKDVCLVLTGSKGWDYNKIFNEIENSQSIKDRIILTGYVPDEDLAPLYSGATAFVYPSFYEGFGLPPLEAMQCGTPVITSNTSSLPEVVGDAGIMIDPKDADALCQSMLDIYNNPELRQAMSEKSLDRAKLFSWQKYTQDLISAYNTALRS